MYNRGYAYETLIHELGRGRRYGQHPTSVLILDLDHFKKINDARGHLIGDEVLRQVSQTLKRSVREVDIPGRYGGEEFIVIMPETPLEGAHQVAERIRTAVAALRIEARGGPVPISVSIGVAERREGEGADQILARADSALYEAKNAGRNRTVLAA
jgi:diguanylate cyclase (GGDEF)-like protein